MSDLPDQFVEHIMKQLRGFRAELDALKKQMAPVPGVISQRHGIRQQLDMLNKRVAALELPAQPEPTEN